MSSNRNAKVRAQIRRDLAKEESKIYKQKSKLSSNSSICISDIKNKILSKKYSTDSCTQKLEENSKNCKMRRKSHAGRKSSIQTSVNKYKRRDFRVKSLEVEKSLKYRESDEETDEDSSIPTPFFNSKKESAGFLTSETEATKRETGCSTNDPRFSSSINSRCGSSIRKIRPEENVNISREKSIGFYTNSRKEQKIDIISEQLQPIESQTSSNCSNINISKFWKRKKDQGCSEISESSKKDSSIISQPSVIESSQTSYSSYITSSQNTSFKSSYDNHASLKFNRSDFPEFYEQSNNRNLQLQKKLASREVRNKACYDVNNRDRAKKNPFRKSNPLKDNKFTNISDKSNNIIKQRRSKINFEWVSFQNIKRKSVKHFRCFREKDIGLSDKLLKENIVDVQNDDDYDTDDDILDRSIMKVIDDLEDAIYCYKENMITLNTRMHKF